MGVLFLYGRYMAGTKVDNFLAALTRRRGRGERESYAGGFGSRM